MSLQCSCVLTLQTLHMINFGARSLSPPRRMRIGTCPGFPAPAAVRRSRMDDVVNRMARELSDAIAAAVAEDARVEACRERARAAGYEMRVSLEAVIGFVNRTQPGALARTAQPPQKAPRSSRSGSSKSAQRQTFPALAADRRGRGAGEGSRIGIKAKGKRQKADESRQEGKRQIAGRADELHGPFVFGAFAFVAFCLTSERPAPRPAARRPPRQGRPDSNGGWV